MQKNWYCLNLDSSNVLKEDWIFPTPEDPQYGVWNYPAEEIIRKEWLDYVSKLGLTIDWVMLFYRGPFNTVPDAHIDLLSENPLRIASFGLNFVINGIDSQMLWFELPSIETPVKYGPANTPFVTWDPDTLTITDNCPIRDTITLVNVGVPHRIIMGRHQRWCISLRSSVNENMKWDEIVDYLRSLNLLIERP